VHVESQNIQSSMYEEIIQVLKKTHSRRELTFRSAWDASFMEAQSSLKLQFPPANNKSLEPAAIRTPRETGSATKSPSVGQASNHQTALTTPTASTSLATALTPFSQAEYSFLNEPATPPPPMSRNRCPSPIPESQPTSIVTSNPSPLAQPTINTSASYFRNNNTMDISLIRSPSETVLLSQYYSGYTQQEEKQQDIRHGPMIIPIRSNSSWNSASPVQSTEKPRIPSPPHFYGAPSPLSTKNKYSNKSSRTSPFLTLSSPPSRFANASPSSTTSQGAGPATISGRSSPIMALSSPPSRFANPPKRAISRAPVSAPLPISTPKSSSPAALSILCESSPGLGAPDASADGTSIAASTPQAPLLSTPRALAHAPTFDGPSTPFSPSNVKKLSAKYKEEHGAPRMLSRVLRTVYKNVAPVVASSTYAVGSTVATKIAPAVVSTSVAIGTKITNKVGETIVGNSSGDFQEATKLKLQLLKELGHAKAALDMHDSDKQRLEQNNAKLFEENLSLRAEFEQKLQTAQVQRVSTILVCSVSFDFFEAIRFTNQVLLVFLCFYNRPRPSER
jgi:hypothetical protein